MFRSRTQTVNFKNAIEKSDKKIKTEIISTPPNLAIGCGLSVKIAKSDFGGICRRESKKYDGFVGFFETDKEGKTKKMF